MTRQKRELQRKIGELEEWIQVDMQLGCGFAPKGAYDDVYDEIWRLSEELAKISHYESAMDMMMDNRWMEAQTRGGKVEPFPFA